MKKNIAVIGTGYWGKNLVRNFYEIGALGLVCDADPIAVGRMKEQYEGIQAVSDFNEVLACNDIDGVVVATPAETHFSLAAAALRAGKNVYVEKPLVLDEGEGRQLIALAKEYDRILMVGHLLHYHPAFIKLKELVGAGELGRINYIYSNRLNLGKIRREENILFSFAPHDISMIIALAGELPTKVMATGGRYLHHEIADVTTTHLEFSSGLKAQIFVSWLHPFKEQKLVVVGEEKMAVFDDTLPWEEKLLLYPHKIRWEQGAPVPVKADPERVAVTPAEPLRMECEHFLECIKARKAPYTSGGEGLEVLRVLNAAQRSMDNRGLEETLSGEMDPPKWYAHPTAVIDDGVEIGAKSKVWHFSHISTGAKIGERVNIGQSVLVGPGVHIGEGCKIQNNVSVYQGVTLEADVFCGPSMVFTNVFNPRAHIRRMNELRETLVRQGATLGANCTIICGVKIGRHALVGAGAVVTRDVEDHALVLGNPARRTGWICSCGVKLDEQLLCPACGRCYEQAKTGLRARQE